jgi:hypothetical protein
MCCDFNHGHARHYATLLEPLFYLERDAAMLANQHRSYSGGTDAYYSRPDPSGHALHPLAGPRRRLPVLAVRPDVLRSSLVKCFVRNDQRDVLFHRLTLHE